MKLLKKFRNIIMGIIAYIIAHYHDWHCKHYGKGWVYIPWGTTLKEHIEIVEEYFNEKESKQ